jgi:hypothetical protein
MRTAAINHVKVNGTYHPVHAGRVGTAISSLDEFEAKFGEPDITFKPEEGEDSNGKHCLITPKVTKLWTIATPRGRAQISDYWWNADKELSIRTENKKTLLWTLAWLRCNGVKACVGNHSSMAL